MVNKSNGRAVVDDKYPSLITWDGFIIYHKFPVNGTSPPAHTHHTSTADGTKRQKSATTNTVTIFAIPKIYANKHGQHDKLAPIPIDARCTMARHLHQIETANQPTHRPVNTRTQHTTHKCKQNLSEQITDPQIL